MSDTALAAAMPRLTEIQLATILSVMANNGLSVQAGAISKHVARIEMDLATAAAVIRTAVADYMDSEGCGCCGDMDAHPVNKLRLAELLHVAPYSDGSGADFSPYRSPKK